MNWLKNCLNNVHFLQQSHKLIQKIWIAYLTAFSCQIFWSQSTKSDIRKQPAKNFQRSTHFITTIFFLQRQGTAQRRTSCTSLSLSFAQHCYCIAANVCEYPNELEEHRLHAFHALCILRIGFNCSVTSSWLTSCVFIIFVLRLIVFFFCFNH